jgi:hypothetical protein
VETGKRDVRAGRPRQEDFPSVDEWEVAMLRYELTQWRGLTGMSPATIENHVRNFRNQKGLPE